MKDLVIGYLNIHQPIHEGHFSPTHHSFAQLGDVKVNHRRVSLYQPRRRCFLVSAFTFSAPVVTSCLTEVIHIFTLDRCRRAL